MNSGRFGAYGGSGFSRGSAQPAFSPSPLPSVDTQKNTSADVSGEKFIGREYLERKSSKKFICTDTKEEKSTKSGSLLINPRVAGMVFGALLLLFGVYQCSARVGTFSQALDRKNPKSIFAPLKARNLGTRP